MEKTGVSCSDATCSLVNFAECLSFGTVSLYKSNPPNSCHGNATCVPYGYETKSLSILGTEYVFTSPDFWCCMPKICFLTAQIYVDRRSTQFRCILKVLGHIHKSATFDPKTDKLILCNAKPWSDLDREDSESFF